MQPLTESVYRLSPPGGLFDEAVVRALFPQRSPGARRALVHRATRCGEVERLKPGLYCLGEPFRRAHPHPFVVAAALHWPSHISLESALAHHGLIPEAVFTTTSVTARRSRSFSTPLGQFTFVRVPADDPGAGVRATELGRREWAFVASPLRAIADLVYVRKREIEGTGVIAFLTQSMRIEPEHLQEIDLDDLDEVCGALRSKRTRRLLATLETEVPR